MKTFMSMTGTSVLMFIMVLLIFYLINLGGGKVFVLVADPVENGGTRRDGVPVYTAAVERLGYRVDTIEITDDDVDGHVLSELRAGDTIVYEGMPSFVKRIGRRERN